MKAENLVSKHSHRHDKHALSFVSTRMFGLNTRDEWTIGKRAQQLSFTETPKHLSGITCQCRKWRWTHSTGHWDFVMHCHLLWAPVKTHRRRFESLLYVLALRVFFFWVFNVFCHGPYFLGQQKLQITHIFFRHILPLLHNSVEVLFHFFETWNCTQNYSSILGVKLCT